MRRKALQKSAFTTNIHSPIPPDTIHIEWQPSRMPEACADRTLFVTHLDGFVTEAQLKRTFAEAFGAVERLEYKVAEKKPQKVLGLSPST
eukprot:5308116-Amphidinium_carterae.1